MAEPVAGDNEAARLVRRETANRPCSDELAGVRDELVFHLDPEAPDAGPLPAGPAEAVVRLATRKQSCRLVGLARVWTRFADGAVITRR